MGEIKMGNTVKVIICIFGVCRMVKMHLLRKTRKI